MSGALRVDVTDMGPGSLKAVEAGYPFYGEVDTDPAAPLDELLRDDTVLVVVRDEAVAEEVTNRIESLLD